jgi:hypothetical protein
MVSKGRGGDIAEQAGNNIRKPEASISPCMILMNVSEIMVTEGGMASPERRSRRDDASGAVERFGNQRLTTLACTDVLSDKRLRATLSSANLMPTGGQYICG